jgi:hypothetical protein
LAVNPASGDPRALETRVLHARNIERNEWMRKVKLLLFGSSQVETVGDPISAAVRDGFVSMGR